MKIKPLNFLLAASTLLSTQLTHAASGTWNGLIDATWAGANWSASPVPGTGETATFSGAGNGNTTIDLGGGVTIGTILFDLTPAAYTIGSGGVGAQTLTLNNTGAVTMNTTVANNQLFNANIVLGTAITGTTTITNSSTTNSLTFAGNITGGTGGTAGTKTMNVSAGAGGVVLAGTVTPGGASAVNLINNGVGTLTLTGAGTHTLGTLRAVGGSSTNSTVLVNNAAANITVANSSTYGPGSTGSSDFILTAGTIAFNGGLTQANNSADGGGFIINGGTFSAASIFTQRTFNFSTSAGATTATAQSMGTSGFQVNAGIASVTGNVNLAGSNSSANGQVSGSGSLTIGGELQLGTAATTRTTLFQVTGGTLTNTDVSTGGIVIGRGSATVASSGELLLTGGTTTTEKISFGLNGGLAGSYGNLTMNGASANLYVGSGGIVLAATNAYTSSINLSNGTLGAKVDWSSSMNMSFTGSGMSIKAADAVDVARNITLSGVLSGANGFSKTGGGTLTLSGANNYAGTTSISGGILKLSGSGTLGATSNTVGVIASGAALDLNGTNQTIGQFSGTSAGQIQNNSGSGNSILTVSGASPGTFTGVIANHDGVNTGGTVGLTLNSAGTLTLTNSSSYSGGTIVSAGTLALNSSGTNVNSGHLGSGALTLANGATLSFTGNSNSSDTLGMGNALSVNSGATATINFGERSVLNSDVTGDSTTMLKLVAGTIDRNDLGGNWTNFSGTLVFNDTNSTVRAMELTNNGGTFNVTGLLNATVDVQEANLRVTANTGGNTVKIGALTGSASGILGGNTSGGSVTWEIGNKNINTNFAGVIADGNNATKLTKVGTGIQTLSGTSTYTGTTNITGGTLALSGTASISSSATIIVGASTTFDVSAVTGGYTLASGQTISGTGSVVGAMNVSGTLSPGNSPGSMTTGSQTWLDGGDYNWQILDATGSAGTGYDTIAITGTLDLASLTAGGFGINLWSLASIGPDVNGAALNFLSGNSYSWTLATTTAGINNFDAADFLVNIGANNGTAGFSNSLGGGSFSIAQSGNNLILYFTPVPEPRAALLGGLGLLVLLRRRRA